MTFNMPGLFLVLLLVSSSPLWAAQSLAEHWGVSAQESDIRPDHRPWQQLLDRYLVDDATGVNRFRYGDVSVVDGQRLSDYIRSLEAVKVTALRASEQKAYWINLYNALTVRVVLDHFPVKSIRDIRFGLFSSGPWSEELVTVENIELSLDDIEHGILRPVFRDNRIHYAVNCASVGCPDLLPTAYNGDNVEMLLQQAAVDFVNHPRGVNAGNGSLVVSKLYKWYREDFGENEQQVMEHLQSLARPLLRQRLEEVNGIDGYQYDWSLNSAAGE